MFHIEVKSTFSFTDFKMDINLNMESDGVLAIFGPSGSGKTTLLRIIAGLQSSTQSYVKIDDAVWQDNLSFIKPHLRNLAFIFQNENLFSHLSVEGNLNYAQSRSGRCQDSISRSDAIDFLGIASLLKRNVHHLSGGEKQRVAIARALLSNPRLLLMDEPLAAIDDSAKNSILGTIENIKREFAIPVLYVSHSVQEISRLATEMILLEKGKIVRTGKIGEVLAKLDFPQDLGQDTSVVLDGKVIERDREFSITKIGFRGGVFWLCDNEEKIDRHVRMRILAKDVSITLEKHANTSILNVLQAQVIEISSPDTSSMVLVKLMIGESPILARITRKSLCSLNLGVGAQVWVQIKSVALM